MRTRRNPLGPTATHQRPHIPFRARPPMIETYQNLLQELARLEDLDADLLLETQELAVDGLVIALGFEGNNHVGDVVFVTALGSPPTGRTEDIYRTLLEANHLWGGTGGATLGLQAGTGAVVLCSRSDVAELTGEGLAMLLENFVDVARHWHHWMKESTEMSTDEPHAAMSSMA